MARYTAKRRRLPPTGKEEERIWRELVKEHVSCRGCEFQGEEATLHTYYGTVDVSVRRDFVVFRLQDFPKDHKGDWYWFQRWKYPFHVFMHLDEWSPQWPSHIGSKLKGHISMLYTPDGRIGPPTLITKPLTYKGILCLHTCHMDTAASLRDLKATETLQAVTLPVVRSRSLDVPEWLSQIWKTALQHNCTMIRFSIFGVRDARFEVYDDH